MRSVVSLMAEIYAIPFLDQYIGPPNQWRPIVIGLHLWQYPLLLAFLNSGDFRLNQTWSDMSIETNKF